MTYENPNYAFRILSFDPLITISGCQTDMIFIADLARDLPEIFKGRKGLHLLLPTWNLEGSLATQLRNALETASTGMPGHEFLAICSTEYETHLLGLEGIPALLAHQSMFIDENVWRPGGTTIETLRVFDAVYNARFDAMKRHELARKVSNLLLIYGLTIHKPIAEATEEMRIILPGSHFANEIKGAGTYTPLRSAEIAQLYARARVGLCLSREEGYSRVSTEYMLCGLPVVSTASIGGRDRYYGNEYCRIVEDDEDAVAAAVQQLIERNYSALDVRNKLIRSLVFERANFLKAINRIVEDFSGDRNFFGSIKPFLGIKQVFPSHNQLVQDLRAELARQPRNEPNKVTVLKPVPGERLPRRSRVASPSALRQISVTYRPLGPDVSRALEDWRANGLRPRIFIRDDDADIDHPSLRSLIGMSHWLSVPLLLATIPERCDRSLARTLGMTELVTGAVHGYSHRNYAPEGNDASELGSDRPVDVVLNELAKGRDILLDVFGGRVSKLLVPPWNQISDAVADGSESLGFEGLSTHGWTRMDEAIPRINTHVDLVDWWTNRQVLGRTQIETHIADELDTARELGSSYIGLVTHHRYFSDDDWKTLADVIRALDAQGVEWVDADRLLPRSEARPKVAGAI
ncbi:glycosyltransferase [Nordella sp. HKS 07]|uniref:glycosyltransferase n=1 Tax=Nordella sp. HKS 07 TaxID=2712222 RepID=UPI0013E19322|nr:glycosyltransferase [Nordella sp. HKS 07]QIG52184.1 glycosyltransferase [Nordella sp. HKS 07]